MELSERKKKILASVIERYIQTGEPVGSKVLCEGLSVSSATIRNEMSELSEFGYLEQPHTSAGRIPSQKGIRFYVNYLMPIYETSDSELFAVHNFFDSFGGEPDDILRDATKLLSEQTGCAVAALTPYDINAFIRRVELVPLGSKSALVVILMSTGVVKSRICRCSEEIDYNTAELFYNVAGAHFVGRTYEELTVAKLQTIVASLGGKALQMIPLLIVLADLANEASQLNVIIEGQSKLFSFRELESDVYRIFEHFKHTSFLSEIIHGGKDELNVLIGRESMNRAFENVSIISHKYSVSGKDVGSIAVLGPLRMDYSRIISNLKNVTQSVSRVLTELTEE